jgi:hypothetical protein
VPFRAYQPEVKICEAGALLAAIHLAAQLDDAALVLTPLSQICDSCGASITGFEGLALAKAAPLVAAATAAASGKLYF